MTRDELTRQIIEKQANMSYKTASAAVKYVTQLMSEALSKGTRIELRGFGSFALRCHQPKLVRNPKTGEQLQGMRKYVVHFKPSKELKERVNSVFKNDQVNISV